MAYPLNPLPRRLFELLEEQQEPFLLELGCSKRCLKSKGAFRCWNLSHHGFRRRRVRGGILRCLAAKLVHLKALKKALNCERSKLATCFREVRNEANASGFHRLSFSSAAGRGESSGEIGWKETEHSPVSVLELHCDESSSDHNHLEEENPSSPRLNSPTKFNSIQPRVFLLDFLKELEDNNWDPYEVLSQKMSMQEIFQCEEQRGDVAMINQLQELDLSGTRREWTQFKAERREIGGEIGGIIFEEMSEECVFDMLSFHCTLKTSP